MIKTVAVSAALLLAGALAAIAVPGFAQDSTSSSSAPGSATSELCVYASSAEAASAAETSSAPMPSSSSAEMASSSAAPVSSEASSVDLTTSNNDCLQSGTVSSSAAM
jgi:hypothetical protein